MCFSATASFTATVVLSAIGTASFTKIPSKRELLLGSFPWLFAIQQFSEGMVWLTVGHPSLKALNGIFTEGYLLFATGLWPILCPLSIYLLEQTSRVRKIISGIVLLGFLQGIYLFGSVVVQGVSPVPFSGHLLYDLNFIPFYKAHQYLYLFLTVFPFLIASHRLVKVVGLFGILAFGIAELFYQITFVSVWCFFAAIISAGIYLILSNFSDKFTQISQD